MIYLLDSDGICFIKFIKELLFEIKVVFALQCFGAKACLDVCFFAFSYRRMGD
jgi:hypothetical protein